jgi:pimeloyl-ACP methyl ester carboxylesterase
MMKLSSLGTTMYRRERVKRTYVLVHGFWLGSWAWSDVATRLETAGNVVIAPTLPGNESADADRSKIGLREHVEAISKIIDGVNGEIVIVGHSAGGAVVHAIVDRYPDRISRAIYVDTRPLPNGVALNPALAGDGDEVPLRALADFAPGWLDGLDDDALALFSSLTTPSAAGAARDLQVLADPARYDVPVTIVATTTTGAAMLELGRAGDPYFTELPLLKHLEIVDLPTGHYPMLSRPAKLAEVILAAGAGERAA